ncbi:HEAT repeat domain-containing protein [Micromonospora wenchangensis]|uniref:HEAT repeat domain-containing protein n=1 Tax=Micromonospora wenchangensis TaxID=1185415 RepID=UPI003D71A5F4
MLIGEVSRRCGVSVRMLRHYESLGLLRPTGRSGVGYREYSGADLRRIFHIESLRSLGLSLRAVGRALDDPAFTPTELVDDLIRRTRERITAEQELLTRLRRIDAAGPADWQDVLQVVALLRDLGSPRADQRQRAALASVGELPVPVEALVTAALDESDPNVAGALRWALAHAGVDGLPLLAEGLDAPAPEVRERAVRAIVEIPGGDATALLREALRHPDPVVGRYAALALGGRGEPAAVPTLIDMIVAEVNDVDAADALSALATDPATAERIATRLIDLITHGDPGASVRSRLTQALAGIPGDTTSRALAGLTGDDDRVVALTASYLLTLRSAPDGR